jgi:hypothetical protein
MYGNLDRSKHQIRLLRLLPGHGSDDILCRLFTASLDESNDFEALSYVWGSQANPVQIVVDGENKVVTSNLASALHYLRNDEKERVMWVDAVCINQSDLDEQSSQVQLMQRIYSGASQVVVWQGPPREGWDETIELVGRLGSYSELHWKYIPDLDFQLLRIFWLLNHEWWQRIWTAQEGVLAKQVVFHFGNAYLSHHYLINMAKSFRMHLDEKRCCGTSFNNGDVYVTPDFRILIENILQLHQLQLRIGNINFDEAARIFRHRQATNPRDKVYGLLGMSRGIRESSINYKFSTAEVYELATRDNISYNSNLDILSHISHGKEISRDPISGREWHACWPKHIPSWVPDWADRGAQPVGDSEFRGYKASFLNQYNACGTLIHKSTGNDVVGKLHVFGVCCDTVRAISNQVTVKAVEETGAIKDWRNMVGMENDPSKAYIGGDTMSEAFLRTLCLDVSVKIEGETVLISRAGAEERSAYLMYWCVVSESYTTICDFCLTRN